MVIASKGTRPLVATGASNFVITVWDAETGYKLRTFEGHSGPVTDLIFWEHFEVLILSASTDRSIRIVDVLTGECVCVLLGHTDGIRSLAVVNGSTDEPVLASVSLDFTLRIWDFATILKTFFRSGPEDHEIGTRNAAPAHVPTVSYVHTSLESKSKKELHKVISHVYFASKCFISSSHTFANKERNEKRRQSLIASPTAFRAASVEGVEGDAVSGCRPSTTYIRRQKNVNVRKFSLLPDEGSYDDARSSSMKMPGRKLSAASPSYNKTKVVPERPTAQPAAAGSAESTTEAGDTDSDSGSGSDADAPPQLAASPSSRRLKKYGHVSSPESISTPHPKLRSDSTRSLDESFRAAMTEMLGLSTRLPSFTRASSVERTDKEAAPIASAISNIASSISKAFGRFSAAVGAPDSPTSHSLKASAVIEEFGVASVAKELDSEFSKSMAAVKLQHRLSLKKNPDLPSSIKSMLSGSAGVEMEILTASKMKEHRLQEQRVKQSLNRAKARSSIALRKRLEEVAAQRRGTGGKAANDSDSDDDDDDDINNDDEEK